MKRFFTLLILCLLTSCIEVDDFGPYWDKGVVDPELAGPWLLLPPPSAEAAHDYPEGQRWRFVEKNGAYEIHVHIEGKPDKEPVYPVKSLVIGGNVYLMAAEPKDNVMTGDLLRYEAIGGVLYFYSLKPEKMAEFLKKNDPDAESITQKDRHHPIIIRHFDEEAFGILSRIPDDEAFWQPEMRLEQIGN